MTTKHSLRQWVTISNEQHKERPIWWTVYDHETQLSTKFNFKADALLFKRTLPHATAYFHWYEDELARLNWSVEPTESCVELRKQRAHELRNTYNYIRLWYSGGPDSHTALMSFVNNNVYIDEIVILLYPDNKATNVADTTANEVMIAAFPQLKQIINLIPNTKITIVEASENDINHWFSGLTDNNKIPCFDALDGDLAQFHLDISWGISKVLGQTNKKNWCDIHGGSKVKLFKNKDKWYSYFVDTNLSTFYVQANSEDFFISRTIPNLYLKTVYNLKNYHTMMNSTDQQVNGIYADTTKHIEYNNAMGRETVHPISTIKLYHTTHNLAQWNNLMVSGAKSMQFYNNVISTAQGQTWYKNHIETQRFLIEEYSEFWNRDADNNIVPYLGYKGHLSTFYCLNDGKTYNSTQVGF